MMSSILTHVLQLLSIFTLLQLQCIGTEAYPITSKPIEWTAENWAWQPWAKQTSEEQSKGKGRKVTPKSIFETPYRNGCPPGHQADANRCIPTVSIDPNELINKQVLAIVGDFNIGSTNFEFDYGDEFGNEGLGIEALYNTYDDPQKFSGGSLPLPTSFDNAGQLPSQDAPLKFDFFEQKLSGNENDTMQDSISYDEDYGNPVRPNNVTTSSLTTKNNTDILADDFVGLFLKKNETMDKNMNNSMNSLNKNSTTIANITALNTDSITESSNISTSMTSSHIGSVLNVELPTATKDFPIDNIDAISLSSSVPMRHLTGTTIQEDIEKIKATTHKVTLHKGDSVVQFITTATLQSVGKTQSNNKNKELSQLVKSDGNLALFGGTMSSSSLSLASNENEKNLIETTFKRPTNYDDNPPSKLLYKETTISIAKPQDHEIIGNEKDSWEQKDKSDHTRSVTESFLMSADDLSAQEYAFITTLEPDDTSSFQLDDTTIIEEFNPPTIELQVKPAGRIKLEEHQLHENNVGADVKSKVQPVSETTTEASPLPLPIAALPDSHQFDIFDGDFKAVDRAVNVTENSFSYGVETTTQTSTLENSHEMHTESEAASSIIYDLVKGINNNNYYEQETTSTTESSAIVETDETDGETETSSTNSEEELSNFEMETTTISSDNKYKNENNKVQQSLVTNADVTDNNDANQNIKNNNHNDNGDDDTFGEIVFVVESHKSNNNKSKPSDNSVSTTIVESGDESYPNENIETASITKTAEATTTTEIITSKRWSKVMPIFEEKIQTSTTEQLVDETTLKLHEIIMIENNIPTTSEKSIKQLITTESLSTSTPTITIPPITDIVTTKSSSISIGEKRSKNNGSRRNSKIIRLDKYPLAASVNRLSESSKLILPHSPISSSYHTPPITTTTVSTLDEETIDTDSSKSNINLGNSDPFWWLPMGWHLDRHENFERHPLLLRLWTTFTSKNQAKV